MISPLLSNLYLHVLDHNWQRSCGRIGKLIRYCDDFVVLCKSRVALAEAHRRVTLVMDKLKLELHPTKTRLVELQGGEQGMEFLGFHLHNLPSSRYPGKDCLYLWPGKAAMKAVRARIRSLLGDPRLLCASEVEITRMLNPLLRGWHQYFRIGNSSKKLQSLERYLRYRLAIYRRRKHQRRRLKLITSQEMERIGFYSLLTGVSYDGRTACKRQAEGSRKAV